MVKEKRITEDNIKDGLANGKKIPEIAQEYGVTPITVLTMVQKMEKDGKKVRNEPIYIRGHVFNLKIGDIFTANDFELSRERHDYEVVYIDEDIYVGHKLTGDGHWNAAFMVSDYMTNHDPHRVRRKGVEEKVDRWQKGRDY
jgi:hypothetical protein